MTKKAGKNNKIEVRVEFRQDPVDHPPCNLCSGTSNNITIKTLNGRKLWLCSNCRIHAVGIMEDEKKDNQEKKK